MISKKNILVAPLNWGLGHASRCIPIIKELIDKNYNPIIASDGMSLKLLQKEFPQLLFLELPSYHIKYPRNGVYFKLKILFGLPKTLFSVYKEYTIVDKWIEKYRIDCIISDNRFGVFSKKVRSIYISHQLNILSGNTTFFSSILHQLVIKRFNECWIPDFEGFQNLSGNLGHITNKKLNLKYIGPLSRFEKKKMQKKFDLMVLLSGPEPQRTLLENELKKEIFNYQGKVIFIKGIVENIQKLEWVNNVLFYNYMTTKELENAINQSGKILCRSGYSTIMDLSKLEKKVFFIPTPGQFEQEYLAKKNEREGIAPFCKQKDFKLKKLDLIDFYSGFKYSHKFKEPINFEKLSNI